MSWVTQVYSFSGRRPHFMTLELVWFFLASLLQPSLDC